MQKTLDMHIYRKESFLCNKLYWSIENLNKRSKLNIIILTNKFEISCKYDGFILKKKEQLRTQRRLSY